LLTQREQVSRSIKQLLQERAKEFHIILEVSGLSRFGSVFCVCRLTVHLCHRPLLSSSQDVSITDLKFGKEFEKAVEAKQVAQQDAERARFIVEKAIQDKQATVIRAQGEARSVELIGGAANPGFIQLRRIDAARTIAQSIAASQNTVYLPSESLLLSMANSLYGPEGVPESAGPASAGGAAASAGTSQAASKTWW
jgi:prohibitin 2